jgi:hypothetical protein
MRYRGCFHNFYRRSQYVKDLLEYQQGLIDVIELLNRIALEALKAR